MQEVRTRQAGPTFQSLANPTAGLASADQLQNGPLTALHSFQGRSTVFGLNMDGSIDPEDNGQGAFGYNTRDPELKGFSLPVDTIKKYIGDYTKDPAVYRAIQSGRYRVAATNLDTGQSLTAPIVDAGPAKWTGNVLDSTLGAARHLGLDGDGRVSYQILGQDGQPISMN